MTEKETTRASKFLSLVLRHEPQAAGMTPDATGWVDVEALLAGCGRAGLVISREQLDHIVDTNAKKRFEFSSDGRRIRASQGHSIRIELDYTPQAPPDMLFHGTATRFLDAIRGCGLQRMSRHHVHLSADASVAHEVGARHGKSAVLSIRAGDMHRVGHVFYQSANGVWLVEAVPPEFILFQL